MNRIERLTHKGKSIILVNLSNCQPAEVQQVLPAAQGIIAQAGPKQARVLTDVSGAVYNKEVSDAIKVFTKNNTPYVKASAVIGAEGVKLVLLQAVIVLTRRELKAFGKRDDALDWLASVV